MLQYACIVQELFKLDKLQCNLIQEFQDDCNNMLQEHQDASPANASADHRIPFLFEGQLSQVIILGIVKGNGKMNSNCST